MVFNSDGRKKQESMHKKKMIYVHFLEKDSVTVLRKDWFLGH